MNYTLIGLYGIYLLFVGYAGKSSQLTSEIKTDLKGFVPWVIAIIVLRSLYEVDTLKPIVKPFAGLAILAFSLKNYDTIAGQINLIAGKTYLPLSKGNPNG